MKRLVISLSILLIASLGLISAFAATADRIYQIRPEPTETDMAKSADSNDAEANKIMADARLKRKEGPLADPNKVKAAVREFEGLEQELEQVDSKSSNEIRLWLQRETDNRIGLAKSAHDQAEEEIMLIRKTAVEEGAKKTIAAIDGLLLSRQERFDKLIEKLREERRELRRTQSTRSRYRPGQRGDQDRRVRGRTPEQEQGQLEQQDNTARPRTRRR